MHYNGGMKRDISFCFVLFVIVLSIVTAAFTAVKRSKGHERNFHQRITITR